MAHDKAWCSFGGGTAKCTAHYRVCRAARTATCICCVCSGSDMASGMAGSCDCKAPCTCESRSGDSHTAENSTYETDPDDTGHMCLDMHAHILAAAYKGCDKEDPPPALCRNRQLAGYGHNAASS